MRSVQRAIREARAFGDGLLENDLPVMHIYADEAGTSDRELTAVVAGIVIHDSQWRTVLAAIEAVLDECVPPQFRDGFWFHGKEVFSGGKAWNGTTWPIADRMHLFKAFLEIPARTSLSACIAGSKHPGRNHKGIPTGKMRHILAFTWFLVEADGLLTRLTAPTEVATLVCEDAPEVRRHLNETADDFRNGTSGVPQHLRLARIIDCPHFVEKRRAPILQLADALAFATRRHVEGLANGRELYSAIFGGVTPEIAWENDHFTLSFGFRPKPKLAPGNTGASPPPS